MSDSEPVPVGGSRVTEPLRSGITLPSATNVVIASMIGAGVYTTSGFALADLGSPILVLAAWAVGGLLALCGAFSYGGLARRFAESGGEYLFLSRALHPAAGYVAGFVSLLAGFTGAIAFAALTFEAYWRGMAGGSADGPSAGLIAGWPAGTIAVGLVVLAGLMHGFRVSMGTRVQDSLVWLKVTMLVAFLVFALGTLVTADPLTPWAGLATAVAPPDDGLFATFAVSLMWISLSYSGFNAAIYITSEVRDGGRTVRTALWAGTLAVTLIYLALNAVFVLAPPSELVLGKQDIAAETARYIGGPIFEKLFRGTILISLATSVLSLMMTGPRVYAKMADDGVLPKRFAFRAAAPGWGIFAQGVLAIVVIQLASLRQLLSYLGLTLSLSAALTVTTLFVLRRRGESIVVFGYPWTPFVFVFGTLGISAVAGTQRPIELAVAVGTLGFGVLAYALQTRFGRRGQPVQLGGTETGREPLDGEPTELGETTDGFADRQRGEPG
ncbi:MAG: APC family permease [Planctomycetaceae bacterium]|nr:MAG: APC family permease [Planctomycetaceae bacterium]